MKTIEIVIVIFTFIGGMVSGYLLKIDDKITLKKENEVIEVWQDGYLLLEFTEQNTDSLSLKTLEYIYGVQNEHKTN